MRLDGILVDIRTINEIAKECGVKEKELNMFNGYFEDNMSWVIQMLAEKFNDEQAIKEEKTKGL